MGHLLSHPITSKYVQTCGNAYYRCGAAEMQGYRTNMEDTHNTILSLKQWKANRQKSGAKGNANHSNNNSDHSTSQSSPSPPDPNEVAFFAIYDGHSGPAAAEFACVDLPLRVADLPDPFDKAAVSKLVLDSDAAFCKNTQVRAHGCTACFAIVQPIASSETSPPRRYRVLVGNLGDSRCVVIGVDGRIRFVTSDHKPEDEAEAKRIRQAGGSVSFNRVDGELAMSRAIGDYAYKGQPHLSAQQQKVIAVPDIQLLECTAGEKLLIMCDGLVEKATNEQVVQFVEHQLQLPAAQLNPALIMQQLIDFSLDKVPAHTHATHCSRCVSAHIRELMSVSCHCLCVWLCVCRAARTTCRVCWCCWTAATSTTLRTSTCPAPSRTARRTGSSWRRTSPTPSGTASRAAGACSWRGRQTHREEWVGMEEDRPHDRR